MAITTGLLLTAVSSLWAEDNKVLIIVNSGIYSSISSSLGRYKTDLAAEGYAVEEKSWVKKVASSGGDGTTAADIRSYIIGKKDALQELFLSGIFLTLNLR